MSKKSKNKLPNYYAQICVFNTFSSWVNHASSWLRGYRSSQIVCLDTQNRICEIGADFMRADEEDTFPIKVYETIKSSNKTKCLIDISELRIGNLVKIKTSNDAAYYPIYAIDGMGLKVILGGVRQCEGWKDISLLKPIRITETLLGKLGFQFTPEGDDAYEQIWRSEEGFEVWEHSKGFSCDLIDGDVKSLHQLQNLHFFLTQKELYIK